MMIYDICVPVRWYCNGMRTTIDKAGRVVIPKQMRDDLGLRAGTEVDIVVDGNAIRIDGPEPEEPEIDLLDGWLPQVHFSGKPMTVDDVRRLRLGMQRGG